MKLRNVVRSISLVNVICRGSTYITLALFSVILFVPSNSVRAAISESQPLHFGTFALANNLTVSTLRVPFDGNNPVATNNLYPLSFGQAGHYQLTSLPAFMPLIITISDYVLQVGAAEEFSVSSFTYPALMTNASGEALLKVGATLSTTGSGTEYGDAVYTGIMNIMISW